MLSDFVKAKQFSLLPQCNITIHTVEKLQYLVHLTIDLRMTCTEWVEAIPLPTHL